MQHPLIWISVNFLDFFNVFDVTLTKSKRLDISKKKETCLRLVHFYTSLHICAVCAFSSLSASTQSASLLLLIIANFSRRNITPIFTCLFFILAAIWAALCDSSSKSPYGSSENSNSSPHFTLHIPLCSCWSLKPFRTLKKPTHIALPLCPLSLTTTVAVHVKLSTTAESCQVVRCL